MFSSLNVRADYLMLKCSYYLYVYTKDKSYSSTLFVSYSFQISMNFFLDIPARSHVILVVFCLTSSSSSSYTLVEQIKCPQGIDFHHISQLSTQLNFFVHNTQGIHQIRNIYGYTIQGDMCTNEYRQS